MNQRMMIRQNILVLGFNPEEQNRLVELLSSSESDCPFCVWIEPGTENPDLVLERFRPGMTPFSRMHQVPVLGLVWREDANKIQHDFVYQDVLLWETLSADWLAVSVRRVIERFLRESERRDTETRLIVRERLASVGLFASSIAHEIGTPLGVIRGKAEFQLLKHQDDPRYVRDLNVMIQQVDRIARYVRSVVDLGAGSSSRGWVTVSLCSIMAEVLALMEPALVASGISVSLSGREWGPGAVNVEPEAFRQVLFELFSNSIHAIDAGIKRGLIQEGRIRASYRHHSGRVECVFEDNGVGMSPEELEGVFHPFRSNKGFGEGWGLGLSISYRLIESWNGTLGVESQPGAGTRVVFSLPEASIQVRSQIEQALPGP
jgi:signal transduction histidine kinase